ncbi:MAG: transcription antitermination factor NusB, partial [Gammaproteobacteria bacterium]
MTDNQRRSAAGARNLARRRAMQALYQWQVTGQSGQDIYLQFSKDDEHSRVDKSLFRQLVRKVIDSSTDLDVEIGTLSDRPVSQLDPVEHGILLIGLYELQHRHDVPYRVVINEAVDMCREYGAEDGHKFVNALLDRASRKFRADERQSKDSATKKSGDDHAPE